MSPSVPSFHDGYLTGVELADGRTLVRLKQVDGDEWLLTLEGVQALHVEDFREGNIISHVDIVRGTRPDRSVLERLFSGPHPSAAKEYHDIHAKVIEGKEAQVESDKAVIVVITPSYGADLAALCSAISFARLGVDDG